MPNDPNRANIALAKRPPSGNFPFGTDWLGRCVYSRILAGASASVFSSIFVVAATLGIGATIGVMCGYLGGLVDTLLMRLVDIFLAFPGMVLALAVAGILGPGMRNAIIALVAVGWPQYARLARSCVLTLRRANFIYAAQLNGQSSVEIMCRHILPNVIRLLIVTASLSLGGTLTSISGLSFLGLGARPPLAEWGSMLSDGRSFLQQSPWLVLFPGLAILLTAILFNMLGDCVRDALDPREKNKNIIF
jgi:ABC-type dipeptide/oligopeptide/nickel transport system permease subunit